MLARLEKLVARLVLVALLAVNTAWAADVHGPETATADVAAAGLHGAHEAADSDSPPSGRDEGAGHDHCLHCYGGSAQPPLVTAAGPAGHPSMAAAAPAGPGSARPPFRISLPPERPPRA